MKPRPAVFDTFERVYPGAKGWCPRVGTHKGRDCDEDCRSYRGGGALKVDESARARHARG
jgi:hypothetical protein